MQEPLERFPTSLRDRYEPLRLLGEGGMGEVWLVREVALGRPVALKLTLDVHSERALTRFEREATLLARVKSPQVCEVYDTGEVTEGPYLVMEYLPGPSLLELREKRGGTLPWDEAWAAMREVAKGLEAVHAAELIHRDVKPSNILQVKDRVVLIDFGLAHDPSSTRLTRTGAVVGTVGYLAPECLHGQAATPAADWYGWGASLYALVEGRVAVPTARLLATARPGDLPEPPFDTLDPDGPEALLLLATLQPEPTKRPTSLAQLEAQLQGKGKPVPRRARLGDEAAAANKKRRPKGNDGTDAAGAARVGAASARAPALDHEAEAAGPSGRVALGVFLAFVLLAAGGAWMWRAGGGAAPPVAVTAVPVPDNLVTLSRELRSAQAPFDLATSAELFGQGYRRYSLQAFERWSALEHPGKIGRWLEAVTAWLAARPAPDPRATPGADLSRAEVDLVETELLPTFVRLLREALLIEVTENSALMDPEAVHKTLGTNEGRPDRAALRERAAAFRDAVVDAARRWPERNAQRHPSLLVLYAVAHTLPDAADAAGYAPALLAALDLTLDSRTRWWLERGALELMPWIGDRAVAPCDLMARLWVSPLRPPRSGDTPLPDGARVQVEAQAVFRWFQLTQRCPAEAYGGVGTARRDRVLDSLDGWVEVAPDSVALWGNLTRVYRVFIDERAEGAAVVTRALDRVEAATRAAETVLKDRGESSGVQDSLLDTLHDIPSLGG